CRSGRYRRRGRRVNTDVVLAAALPALPGAAGLAGLLLRPTSRRWAAALGVTTAAAALVAAVALWVRLGTDTSMPRRYADYLPNGSEVDAATRLSDFGPLHVLLSVRVDIAAAVVAVMVCVVALAVQVYSIA